MGRAILQAARARHSTSPNPMVGAVIVRDGVVIGEGHHRVAGGPHAEVAALRQAGTAASGATMYVTMEPCAHQGRTGPCSDAVVAAGLTHVVVAHRDPSPGVNGRGLRRMRDAGITVAVGDGEHQARALNPGWLRAVAGKRPFLALKFAATLDGKTATRTADSRWITGELARAETHRLRGAYDAVLVGANTVIADDPQLNVRAAGRRRAAGRQPLRVVIDGRLRTDPAARIHDVGEGGGSLVLAAELAAASRLARFARLGVEVEVLDTPMPSGARLLEALHRRGIGSVLVEGGGDLAWSFVKEGLVERVYAFVGPLVIGGSTAPTPVGGEGFERLAQALRLEIVRVRSLGPDVLIEAVAA
ncbi:MAG: bifunctional diaminohydroxyphosphoribosylaminopyrimidine deaminase/5-amino-6-(5-phosphoribosylamino)uracil reductase RibD [Candidatus Dormibacteria bacterium]